MTKKKLAVKVDKRVINAAQIIFEQLGMTVEEAVNAFLYQVLYTQSIPFSVKLPADDEMERFDLYFKLFEGEEDIEAGRYIPAEEVFARLKEKFGGNPKDGSNS